jgi:hypothetical protein
MDMLLHECVVQPDSLAADFSDPGQSFQRDGGQRFKLIADSLGARKCLG